MLIVLCYSHSGKADDNGNPIGLVPHAIYTRRERRTAGILLSRMLSGVDIDSTEQAD